MDNASRASSTSDPAAGRRSDAAVDEVLRFARNEPLRNEVMLDKVETMT